MNSIINFKWAGCLLTSTNSYSLSKHEARCRSRNNINTNPSHPLQPPQHFSNAQDGVLNNNSEFNSIYLISTDIPLLSTQENSQPHATVEPSPSVIINTIALHFALSNKKVGDRSVDHIIDILHNPDFSLSLFCKSITSFQDCKSITSKLVQNQLQSFNMTRKNS